MANGEKFKRFKGKVMYINYPTDKTRCFKKNFFLVSYKKHSEF